LTQLLLIRHAQNEWVKSGKLAGWTPGIHLNEEGKRQAEALGRRLASVKFAALYSSPLERAVETAEAVARHHEGLQVRIDEGVGEVRYGGWTGGRIIQLARTRLWKVVQGYPSGARFPDGESFLEVQFRLISAIERIAAQHPGGRVAVVAHGDVIKLAVAHFAGMHLDLFQRLVVEPASISVIQMRRFGPLIVRLNDVAHCEQVLNAE